MSKKLDMRKVETALNKAGRLATTGALADRAGRIHGAAAKQLAASALTQKDAGKRK